MNYLSAENIRKSFGERELFNGISLGLSRGDKVALIADNGVGKTSLFKILAGKDEPDSGKVAIRDGVRIGYLSQEPEFEKNLTINELISNHNTEMLRVIHNYYQAVSNQGSLSGGEGLRILEAAGVEMDKLGAWDYERRMKQILTQFNIIDLDQRIGTLSGGQVKRLALALVLLDDPELLLLDEPTNHLDIKMIEWLEKYLDNLGTTILMVTHDRYFLEKVCNQILELSNRQLYHHKGSFLSFLETRAAREEVFSTEVDKAAKLMKSELEWMRRSPKARTSKSKSRIDAFYRTKDKANSGVIKNELQLDISMGRIGGKILEIKHVNKKYDDIDILKGFSYEFKKGERIGIVGDNGTGKTTFLKLLTGLEVPDSGRINKGDTIVYGYYTQENVQLDEDKRVIEILKEIAEVIEMKGGKKVSAAQFLQYFNFTPNMQYTYVSKLSGGEKRRLKLLTVLIKNPNFLILDEPTNDLDLLTLNKLEEFIENFQGCLILVSHDRYFLDKLTDQLFIFEGQGNITIYVGTYTEYRQKEEAKKDLEAKKRKNVQKNDQGTVNKRNSANEKTKLSYKEKMEFTQLEIDIVLLETEKKQMEESLSSGQLAYTKIAPISESIKNIIEQLEIKTTRWIELAEYVTEC